MLKRAIFTLFIFAAAFTAHAQIDGYLVPRDIFVGDRAALVLPLPGSKDNMEKRADDIVLTPFSPDFPSHDSIDFHRIFIERRIGGSRLIIEFTAFVPGQHELPPIDIGGERFTGMFITVNSILEKRSSLALSMPASSLAMPGTSLMLYGTIIFLIVFILFSIWFILKGKILFEKWNKTFTRWKLFVSMKFSANLLYRSVLRGADNRVILDKLSDQFRKFLSSLTGKNCRAMTAFDFENQDFHSSFLGNFFRNCDELRFSGVNFDAREIYKLLDDLLRFIKCLRNERPAEKIEGLMT